MALFNPTHSWLPHLRGPVTSGTTRIQQVVLTPFAAATIRNEVLGSADGNETGGILLGHIDGNVTAQVLRAGGRTSRCASTHVLPARSTPRQATRHRGVPPRWQRVDWRMAHPPDGSAAPSLGDLHTHFRFVADPQLQFDAFISIILAAPLLAPGTKPGRAHGCSALVRRKLPR
jgi:hypothetical protein